MDTTQQGSGWSGLFQSLATGAMGYLDKRLDVQRDTALARLQQPQIIGTQTPIQNNPAAYAGFDMGGMLPLLLVGAVAIFLLKD